MSTELKKLINEPQSSIYECFQGTTVLVSGEVNTDLLLRTLILCYFNLQAMALQTLNVHKLFLRLSNLLPYIEAMVAFQLIVGAIGAHH